jgi:hypothetical protein
MKIIGIQISPVLALRVSGDKDGELLYMTQNQIHHRLIPPKRKNILEEEFEVENGSRFIVLALNQKPITKFYHT